MNPLSKAYRVWLMLIAASLLAGLAGCQPEGLVYDPQSGRWVSPLPTATPPTSPLPTAIGDEVDPTLPPSPTAPPVPTLLPTPVVTPIPVASPPFIPEVVGKAQQPFWIIYWQGDEVWRIDDQGQNRELLVNTDKSLGHWLTDIPEPLRQSDCCWVGPRVAVSPDGQKVALVTLKKTEHYSKGDPLVFTLYVLDVQSKELNLFSEGTYPVWSLNSQHIAFLKDGALWMTNFDLTQVTKLAEPNPAKPEQAVRNMAWSPDGNTIAYVLAESMGSFPEYWIKDIHSQSPPRLLLPATTYAVNGLTWSPDGQRFLYVSSEGEGSGPDGTDNLWTISAKDGVRTQLTQDMTTASWVWSPDGTWIVISATKHYERDLFLYDIWLLRPDGEQLIRVTSAPPQDIGAYWSPDGTRLIFLREGVGLVTLSLETGKVISLGIDPSFQYAIGGAK